MNYFAHARHYLHDPYFVAGTAVPDWLSVVNRRMRARSRLAVPHTSDDDPRVASIARGIVQHHHDDAWFHQTRAFAELNLYFTKEIRALLPDDHGFRPSFLGHILVELLLDAALIEENPQALDDYYSVVEMLDPYLVNRTVNRMATQQTGMLAFFIPRFSAERFLYDYAEDGKLLFRLNNVMRRVRLPALPETLAEFLPEARRLVQERSAELLAGEQSVLRNGSIRRSGSE
ncbi:MAG: hypothetical protein H6822_27765 [Planctomycetaceae bacterium]|nr:hypothetical protein [Planctomycetales bacterium]MCB9925978.1 hypothetical protein [Planctomycetaceae bacterium]